MICYIGSYPSTKEAESIYKKHTKRNVPKKLVHKNINKPID